MRLVTRLVLALQRLTREAHLGDDLLQWITRLVRVTRPQESSLPQVREWLRWGAGPRASQNLVLGAKAWAILNGRHEATRDDVRFVAGPVLGHRLVTNFAAEAEGINPTKVVQKLLDSVE